MQNVTHVWPLRPSERRPVRCERIGWAPDELPALAQEAAVHRFALGPKEQGSPPKPGWPRVEASSFVAPVPDTGEAPSPRRLPLRYYIEEAVARDAPAAPRAQRVRRHRPAVRRLAAVHPRPRAGAACDGRTAESAGQRSAELRLGPEEGVTGGGSMRRETGRQGVKSSGE